ncbi:MAG: glycosyltransferase [Actinobacteria bacterium]|nr:glycosyltransferase [Actinomycetota bacterium]
MRIAIFCHSIVSDWNHGNAHFLRGVARELLARGHDLRIFEPCDGWSRRNLIARHGEQPLEEFRRAFPELRSTLYDLESLDVDAALDGVGLAIVHEWNDPRLVRRIGLARVRSQELRVLFHDTHHRSVTKPRDMGRYDLRHYDGVLAYGEVIRQLYLERAWTERAWTWHEAADVRLFKPLLGRDRAGDLVWIGNWGDGERTTELSEFLLEPARTLGLTGSVFGVRYPRSARRAIAAAGLPYRGWVANHRVPEVFARHAVTVHIPRRPYVDALPGIPTIRPFEALACGIPLVCSRWDDVEGLFTPGEDFLVARDGQEMQALLGRVLRDRDLARHLAQHGRRTILERHTCSHRVDELLAIAAELGVGTETDETLAAGTVS